MDLLFQGLTELAALAKAEGIAILLGMVALGGLQLDELAAPLYQLGQLLLLRGGCRGSGRWEGPAVG